jgi:hypothetical protein
LQHIAYYTKSDKFVQPDKCFKATFVDDGYVYEEVPLDSIECDYPPAGLLSPEAVAALDGVAALDAVADVVNFAAV